MESTVCEVVSRSGARTLKKKKKLFIHLYENGLNKTKSTVVKKNSKLLLFLFIVPLFLGFVISFATPLLQYFRFVYLIPIMCLLIALSAKKSGKA